MAGAGVDDLGEEGFDEGGEAVGAEVVAGVEGGDMLGGGKFRGRKVRGEGEGEGGFRGEGGHRCQRSWGRRRKRRRGFAIVEADVED